MTGKPHEQFMEEKMNMKDEIQEHIERLYGERHQSKPTAKELLAEMILNIEEEIEISVTTNDDEPNVFLIRLEKLEGKR